jgi:cytochrome c553
VAIATAARRRTTPLRRGAPRRTVALAVLAIGLAVGAPRATAADDRIDSLTQAALARTADPKHGQAQFGRHCARCHGAAGRGDASPRVPVLAGQRFPYLVRQLASLSDTRRESANMHRALSGAALHDPQAWADVAAYLEGAPVPAAPRTGDGTHVALGEATFRILCASCHHDDARGDDDGFVPSLRNQHYAYLLSQMHRIPQLHQRDVDENFAALLRSLKDDEAIGIADYLSRRHGSTPSDR